MNNSCIIGRRNIISELDMRRDYKKDSIHGISNCGGYGKVSKPESRKIAMVMREPNVLRMIEATSSE